jgi:predicted nucleic acid-binding protein
MLSTPIRSRWTKHSNSMVEDSAAVVADTSVVINLNACGRASEVLSALPFLVVVTDVAAAEVWEDTRSGRGDVELLNDLLQASHIRVVSPGENGMRVFGELVIGPAADTLDDGEAATIACAVESEINPAIDERKARRICANRFPSLRPLCTVDLFAEASVVAAIGQGTLSDAVFRALREARMRVPFERVRWVVDLIGTERAALCPSLPKAARRR